MTYVDVAAHDLAARDLAAKSLACIRPLLAVAGLFAVNGLLIGGFGATLPAMRERLGVEAGGLAVLLVSLSTVSVVSMQILGGWPRARRWTGLRST